jgi:hypothetical protein
MTLISTVTVGAGGASTIDFNSIPQTGTDLLLLASARTNQSSLDSLLFVSFLNGANDYLGRHLIGSGGAASSSSYSGYGDFDAGVVCGANATNSTFSSNNIYFPNYALTTAKSLSAESVIENNSTSTVMKITAGSRASTNAITRLWITAGGNTFVQNSVFSLYMITKGSGGATVS